MRVFESAVAAAAARQKKGLPVNCCPKHSCTWSCTNTNNQCARIHLNILLPPMHRIYASRKSDIINIIMKIACASFALVHTTDTSHNFDYARNRHTIGLSLCCCERYSAPFAHICTVKAFRHTTHTSAPSPSLPLLYNEQHSHTDFCCKNVLQTFMRAPVLRIVNTCVCVCVFARYRSFWGFVSVCACGAPQLCACVLYLCTVGCNRCRCAATAPQLMGRFNRRTLRARACCCCCV